MSGAHLYDGVESSAIFQVLWYCCLLSRLRAELKLMICIHQYSGDINLFEL